MHCNFILGEIVLKHIVDTFIKTRQKNVLLIFYQIHIRI